jgi:pseudaminic acid cytidylyltransferase
MNKKIAIITARGGSKRIPRKNIKFFLGKPIIAYSIEASINSGLFDEVMVSTDDLEIADIAKKYGANVPFLRSINNSNDFATTTEVLLEVLNIYKAQDLTFELACCIYPTAPFVTSKNLQEGFEKMILGNFDTLFPIVKYSFPIQRSLNIKSSKLVLNYPEFLTSRSQDLQFNYHDAGQYYWFKTDILEKKGKLLTENTGYIIRSEMEVQDIDTIEDWQLAELKYRIANKYI